MRSSGDPLNAVSDAEVRKKAFDPNLDNHHEHSHNDKAALVVEREAHDFDSSEA